MYYRRDNNVKSGADIITFLSRFHEIPEVPAGKSTGWFSLCLHTSLCLLHYYLPFLPSYSFLSSAPPSLPSEVEPLWTLLWVQPLKPRPWVSSVLQHPAVDQTTTDGRACGVKKEGRKTAKPHSVSARTASRRRISKALKWSFIHSDIHTHIYGVLTDLLACS